MINGRRIITLCGSTKFKDKFREVEKELTLKGYIVLSLSVFSHTDNDTLPADTISMLKEIHKIKIDMCDEILVININDYMGKGTIEEIEYAISNDKTITYLEIPKTINHRNCITIKI